MLKVLQVIPNHGWAIDKLMKLVNPKGYDIVRHYMDDTSLINADGFDIIDWGLWCNIPPEPLRRPSILTMHHIERGHEQKVKEAIELSMPTIIVASSKAVQKDLKKIGFDSELIPLAVPPQKLRVGYIGAESSSRDSRRDDA
jgi:hypothetical protein